MLWAWAPAVAWASLIITMSSIPSGRIGPSELWDYDKLIHAAVFGILAGMLMRAMILGATQVRWAWWFVLSVGLTAAFGVSDEWHQSFTPGRDASGADVIADVVGAGLGASLSAVRYRGRARDLQA
jgi:VanZ family protein